MIWLLPFIASLRGRLGDDARQRFLVACVMTTVIYPYTFRWLLVYQPFAVALLVCRNLLLVKLWCSLTFGNFGPAPDAPATAGDGRVSRGEASNESEGSRAGRRPPSGDAAGALDESELADVRSARSST